MRDRPAAGYAEGSKTTPRRNFQCPSESAKTETAPPGLPAGSLPGCIHLPGLRLAGRPQAAGTQHRNHCPNCLASVHLDDEPGTGRRLRRHHGPVAVWVRKGGEWAIIHRCKICGVLHSNRVAADDNPMLLMSLAVKPLAAPPFPLDRLERAAE
ncbi:MAG: RNHCP domain-containing protein [Dysosmobacter welbionis]